MKKKHTSVAAVVGKKPSLFVSRKKTVVLAVGIFLVFVVGVGAWQMYKKYDERNQAKTGLVSDLTKQLQGENDKAQLVQQYSEQYGAATNDVQATSPSEWDKQTIDKAYTSLLYADKIGAFNQVYTVLALLETAQNSGVDIDNNGFGIDQTERNNIRNRANDAANKSTSKAGEKQ